jgi:hypothetical protein
MAGLVCPQKAILRESLRRITIPYGSKDEAVYLRPVLTDDGIEIRYFRFWAGIGRVHLDGDHFGSSGRFHVGVDEDPIRRVDSG